ncbi:MAG: hypothetical protein KAI29_21815 [Cyclobacteriaceae bacterium]|nr:hypothetical protein [Cyclobacteriaceae bacterium]MCK5209070.1 hypothetical protein [Cyclobacteriaceae bacterium]MCK5703817.1 hypothetical protein [Cyclobacteriaceae bacterium]
MRNLVVVIAIVFTCLASCTQRTCPTYTKGLKEVPQEQPVKTLVKAKEDKRV